MAKRRRKLSKVHEKRISTSLKELELILAKINDIDDDDIRYEYAESFAPVKLLISDISAQYKDIGFTDDSDTLYGIYQAALLKFKNEYEI